MIRNDMYEDSLFQKNERAVFALRRLFLSNNYKLFNMRKFEEYGLYAENKEFLVSDNVITFTDGGKLMALKPDVTLSIIKSCADDIDHLEKLFYNENVYRASRDNNGFTEIMQVGAECIGNVTDAEICENISMALSSLKIFSDRCVLSLCDLDIIREILSDLNFTCDREKLILKALNEKNINLLNSVLEDCSDNKNCEKLRMLISIGGNINNVLNAMSGLFCNSHAFAKFKRIMDMLTKVEYSNYIMVDFSITCDMNYYNGIVFKGYINGIPEYVLSGGQYDNLMEKMGKKSRAIGFAVYTERLNYEDNNSACENYINVALPKGRLGESIYKIFAKAGYECPSLLEPGRKLIFENNKRKVRYFWVKPSDVAIYVERGAADIGVCGKDILLEYEPDVYELLDLKKGKCHMAVAGCADFNDNSEVSLRVATKFTNIAKKYYQSIGRDIDIIHLNGSIEIAPILGISDVIVDIVETGITLKENGLTVIKKILPISARLIANKSSKKFKGNQIDKLVRDLSIVMEEKDD